MEGQIQEGERPEDCKHPAGRGAAATHHPGYTAASRRHRCRREEELQGAMLCKIQLPQHVYRLAWTRSTSGQVLLEATGEAAGNISAESGRR